VINIQCNSCNGQLECEDRDSGSTLNCPGCGASVTGPRRSSRIGKWLKEEGEGAPMPAGMTTITVTPLIQPPHAPLSTSAGNHQSEISNRQTELLGQIANDLHLVYLVVLWGIILGVIGLLLSIAHNFLSIF
jgi:hypothetical protein